MPVSHRLVALSATLHSVAGKPIPGLQRREPRRAMAFMAALLHGGELANGRHAVLRCPGLETSTGETYRNFRRPRMTNRQRLFLNQCSASLAVSGALRLEPAGAACRVTGSSLLAGAFGPSAFLLCASGQGTPALWRARCARPELTA